MHLGMLALIKGPKIVIAKLESSSYIKIKIRVEGFS